MKNIKISTHPIFRLLMVLSIWSFSILYSFAQINDVGIIHISTSASQCDPGFESVNVTLKNFGSNPQGPVPFKYSVNGQDAGVMQPTDGLYTGVIGTDSIVEQTFETMFDFSANGVYEIAAWTELGTDMNLLNDTMLLSIENHPFLPYANNFDIPPGSWLVDLISSENSTWEFGIPEGIFIDTAFTGVNAWVTNLTGNYSNSELSYLTTPCIDFSFAIDDPVLGFSINYDTELSFDGAWLESTVDGGVTWEKVGAIGMGNNWYNFDNTFTGIGEVWAGDSGGWLEADITLTGYNGQSEVQFRFAFDSDGSISNEGIGIDDFYIDGMVVSTEEVNYIDEISVIPNPTTDFATLNLDLNEAVDLEISLVNVMGQQLFSINKSNTKSEQTNFDLSNFASGIYFIHIKMNDSIHVERLIRM